MQRGAVAMIDALGFRGIWGRDPRKPSTEAFDTLKAVRIAVEAEAARLGEVMKPRSFPETVRNLVKAPAITVRFLSDTVVIAASVRPRKRAPRKKHEQAAVAETGLDLAARNAAVDAFMRYVVCHCVCAGVRAAALAPRPISYRGVVTAGYFAIEENFILGPAVDEAAGLMEVADAALVWLAPTAGKLRHVLYPVAGDRWAEMVIEADVPLNDGRTVRMKVINPFALSDAAEAKTMRRNLLASMASERLEVVVKRQNTNRFFKAIDGYFSLAALKKRAMERRKGREIAAPHMAGTPDAGLGSSAPR
jgi:hypothetical protein